MFGSAKPVVFDPYRGRRRGGRVPRWLWLLLFGAAVGAGGVVYVEQRVLPPRLTVEDSERLQNDFQRADVDRQRLQREVTALKRQVEVSTAEARKRDEELAATRQALERQRADTAVLVAALPPDPRGGDVEVRAARFSATGSTLAWDLVLTRRGAPTKPLEGLLQLTVAGLAAGGRETTFSPKPLALSVGAHEVLRGSVKLPDDFRPRQTTVQVLDRGAARALGMRVLKVD